MNKPYKTLLVCALICAAFAGCKTKPVTQVDNSNPFFSVYNTPFEVPPFDKIKAKHYMP